MNTNALSLDSLCFLIFNLTGIYFVFTETPYSLGETMITLGVIYTLWNRYKLKSN